MGYRGMGGYVRPTPPTRRQPRGDLLDDYSFGSDFGFGDFDLSDLGSGVSSAIVPSGGGGFLDDIGGIYDDVSGFLGGLGLTGPSIGSAIAKGAKSLFPSGGSAAAAGKASSSAAVARALRGGGGGRRMNPGNFKALRRSMRRLSAFERAAKRVLHFTHPSKTARVKFKFPRRKRRR